MHGIGARCKRLAGLAAIRRVPRVPPVDDVARDGQNRLRVDRTAIGRMLAELLHKRRYEVGRNAVDMIVVVAILREIACDLVTDDEPVVTPERLNLRVFDGGEAVR